MTLIRTWDGTGLAAGALTTASAGTGDEAFSNVNAAWSIVAGNPTTLTVVPATNRTLVWASVVLSACATRHYWKTTALPASETTIMRFLAAGGTQAFRLQARPTGEVIIRDSSGNRGSSSPATITANTEYRIEVSYTSGGAVTATFYEGEATTAAFTIVTAGGTWPAVEDVWFGSDGSAGANGGTYTIRNLAVADNATLIGPWGTPPVGTPVVTYLAGPDKWINLHGGASVPFPVPPRNALVGIYNGNGGDAEMSTLAGVNYDIGSTYYNAGQNMLNQYDVDRLSIGTMPIVGMATKNYGNLGPDSFMDWAGIGAGNFDADLTRWGNQLASYDTELWFAFQIEPEVKINRGEVPSTWTHADFVAAYRQIVAVMKPLAPKVKYAYWVGGSDKTQIDAMYPGDDVIDLIGWDPYVGGGENPATTPQQCWGSFLTWLQGRTWGAGKPYGLFETGFDTRLGVAAQVAFWDAAPQAVLDLGLGWVTLFNRDSGPNTDARITDYPEIVAAYGDAMRRIQQGVA